MGDAEVQTTLKSIRIQLALLQKTCGMLAELKAPAAGHRRTHHNLRILLSLWAGFSNVALQSYRQEGKQ